MPGQIVEKEFPFRHTPKIRLFVIVKTNHESGDDVEFVSQIGQRHERLHAPDHTSHSQQARAFGEHGKIIEIKADDFVSEQLCDVSEVPGATAEIENAFARDNIELDVADAANVDVDPTGKIEIFRPVFARIVDCVAFINLFEFLAIDRVDDCVRFEFYGNAPREDKTTEVASGAAEGAAAGQFRYFVGKAHGLFSGYIAVVARRGNFN